MTESQRFEEWWAQNFDPPKNEAQNMVKSTAWHAWIGSFHCDRRKSLISSGQ